MEITAVIETLPSNTHLNIDVLAAAHSTYSPGAEQDLIPLTIVGAKRWSSQTYAVLKPGEPLEPVRETVVDARGRALRDERGHAAEHDLAGDDSARSWRFT